MSPDRTEAVSEELKGPRTSAPPQALEGFLRKTGLSQDQLEDRDGVWFAVIDRPGRSRRARSSPTRSARSSPISPGPSRCAGATASCAGCARCTRSSRCSARRSCRSRSAGSPAARPRSATASTIPGPITIGGASDYAEKLRACHVIVDQDEREAIIRDGAAAAARDAGLALIEDEGLVVENAGLTEWPVPLLGRFDPDFLDVPREVIVLTMRTNQKYFACAGDDGALAPAFVCTANIDASDGGAAIVEGNRRVLAARLADARFFWEQDLKVPLEEQAKKLDQIVFHEKLGTVADKVERVAKLARWLVEREGSCRRCDPETRAERAAELAKADLVTGMVGEFPELQGVIGGYLAAAQGEPSAVADAIRDHYKPVGQGDEVPTAPVTVAVSLADKLDTLCARSFASTRSRLGRRIRSRFGARRSEQSAHCRERSARSRLRRLDLAVDRETAQQKRCDRSARSSSDDLLDFLRRSPEGAAARGGGSARPDRRGVRAWRGG